MRKTSCLALALLNLGESWNRVHLSLLVCKMGVLIPFLSTELGQMARKI